MQAGTQSPSAAKLSSAHPNSRSLSIGKLNPNPKRNCKVQMHHQQQTQIQEAAQSTSPICSSHPVQSPSSASTNNTATGPSSVLVRSSAQPLTHSPPRASPDLQRPLPPPPCQRRPTILTITTNAGRVGKVKTAPMARRVPSPS
jgi:hypothetical protein